MNDAFDHDDELRARLQATDPAASLHPAAPDGVARLLEDTMGHDPSTRSQGDLLGPSVVTESRETGTRGRGPLTWLVAAAAVLVIAGTGLFLVLDGAPDPSPVADPAPTAGAERTVTTLTAPDPATTGRCMVPTAEVLATRPIAFDGTVESIEGDTVTLEPTQWYAGDATDLVTVEGPSAELRELLVAVEFEEGGRYLVAASEAGEVMVCGFSAPYSGELAATYAKAFGG